MKLLRFVYATNPLYLLSALLAVMGLREMFPPAADPAYSWMLVASMGAYTTLLAVTGVVIVRLGGVWDDARSILCLIALLFVSLSLCFDERLLSEAGAGVSELITCGVFAIIVTESVVRSLRLRFPKTYRIPFYSLLGLLFIAPVGLAELAHAPTRNGVEIGVLVFSCLAALVTLGFVPAVRRGTVIANDNAPWRWPWYPWSVIVLLTLGILTRVYALAVSFGAGEMVGVYLVAPIVFAWSVLLIEVGAKPRVTLGVRCARVAGPLLSIAMVLAQVLDLSSGTLATGFTRSMCEAGFSPYFVSAVLAFAATLWAFVRLGSRVEWSLAVSVALLSFAGPQLGSLEELGPEPWLCIAAGAVFLYRAIPTATSYRYAAALFFLSLGVAYEFESLGLLRNDFVVLQRFALVAALVLGWQFQDRLTALLVPIAAWSAFGMLALTLTDYWTTGSSVDLDVLLLVDGTAFSMLTAMFYFLTRALSLAFTSLLTTGTTMIHAVGVSWGLLANISRGPLVLLAGLVLFVCACLVSAHKAGWFRTFNFWRRPVDLN